MTVLSEDAAFDRALAALGHRRMFSKEGVRIELALLVRPADWMFHANWMFEGAADFVGFQAPGFRR